MHYSKTSFKIEGLIAVRQLQESIKFKPVLMLLKIVSNVGSKYFGHFRLEAD